MSAALFAAIAIQSAQPTFGEMEFISAQTRDAYIHGALAGWVWANADLQSRDQPPLFCLPETLSLSTDQADVIARDFGRDPANVVQRADDYAMILLIALKATFPCSASSEKPPA